MSRYIDADALREKWLCLQGHDFSPSSFVYSIDNAPTVDAVSVVRCRDCRFFKPWDDGDYGKCKTGLSVMADMFCSCGSRADGERRKPMSNEKRLWIIEARDGAWGANGICKGELVRCGECKNWEEKPLINGNGTRFGKCPLMMGLFFKSDFYCADGKRKDNETKLKGE